MTLTIERLVCQAKEWYSLPNEYINDVNSLLRPLQSKAFAFHNSLVITNSMNTNLLDQRQEYVALQRRSNPIFHILGLGYDQDSLLKFLSKLPWT